MEGSNSNLKGLNSTQVQKDSWIFTENFLSYIINSTESPKI